MWFEFRLVGWGWAEAGIGDDVGHATVPASYIGDALGDLLYAVWLCASGAPETRCSWLDEPGEYRWILRREADEVRLLILEFPDDHPPRPDGVGALLFETRQDWSAIARPIALAASRILEKHGESGYLSEWGHPFPSATLALIRTRLHEASDDPETG